MTILRRADFLARFADRSLSVSDARGIDAGLAAADQNRDGAISGAAEWYAAYQAIDRIDRNGNALSLELGTAESASTAGRAVAAMERAAGRVGTPGLRDVALARAFPSGLSRSLAAGARGDQVTAVQYALARLGDLHHLIDGSYGANTTAAVTAFQRRSGLAATGEVDAATLAAIDRALLALPAPPDDPMALLNDFSRCRTISLPSGRVDWNNAGVQAAYSAFVADYWPRMREARVECDCKTVALFLLSRFRMYFQQQTGVALPMPRSEDGRRAIPDAPWTAITAGSPRGYFERPTRAVRPGYEAVRRVDALDPSHSMIYGVNLTNNSLDADGVYRVAHVTARGVDNGGDESRPEIDLASLQVGDLIFMNHNRDPGRDTRIDHCMTVVGTGRDAAGRRQIVLAVGSYDDIADADSRTRPSGPGSINMYMEEVTITYGDDGRILDSSSTWHSEPDALVRPRYTARNTVMELNGGGSIYVARWGSAAR